MGILDFIKQGAQELFIARPDDEKERLVWKWPDPTIPMKSQITVAFDEAVVFCREGKPVGVLTSGRHTLDSSNIPFLSSLLDSITGGNLFRAEVWFVTTREMGGLLFGGTLGAPITDPASGVAVELRVRGEYSLLIHEPAKAMAFFGTRKYYTDEEIKKWFTSQLLKVTRDRIAEQVVKHNLPLGNFAAQTEEIEQLVLEGVKRHLDPYGVTAVRLGDFVVSMDEEDEKMLKANILETAEMERAGRMADKLGAYQQYAAARAIKGAGEGMAKGGGGGGSATEGAGLGVGFGMAQMFQQQLNQPRPPAAPAPAPQAPAPVPPPTTGTVTCPKCQAQVAPSKFCGECGGPLETRKPFCTECGKPKSATAKFCGECGAAQT